MLTITLHLPDGCESRLQRLANRYNFASDKALTLLEWLTEHVKELAIGDELSARQEALQVELQAFHKERLDAARTELVAGLGAVDAAPAPAPGPAGPSPGPP